MGASSKEPKTPNELFNYFATTYGATPWPQKYEVSPLLYARVCQAIINHIVEKEHVKVIGENFLIGLIIGPNNGLMFKNVELILK